MLQSRKQRTGDAVVSFRSVGSQPQYLRPELSPATTRLPALLVTSKPEPTVPSRRDRRAAMSAKRGECRHAALFHQRIAIAVAGCSWQGCVHPCWVPGWIIVRAGPCELLARIRISRLFATAPVAVRSHRRGCCIRRAARHAGILAEARNLRVANRERGYISFDRELRCFSCNIAIVISLDPA